MLSAEGTNITVKYLDYNGKREEVTTTLDSTLGCGGSKCSYDIIDRWVILIPKNVNKNMTRKPETWERVIRQELVGSEFSTSLGITKLLNFL